MNSLVIAIALVSNVAAQTPDLNSDAFDGTYAGIERHLGTDSGAISRERGVPGYIPHGKSCYLNPLRPGKLTIRHGSAMLGWCLGKCTLTGNVNEQGRAVLRGSLNSLIYRIDIQIYPKGAYPNFDVIGQFDQGFCRTILTWTRNQAQPPAGPNRDVSR